MTKILVVDDNEQNIYMLKVLLEGNGYDLVTAINGLKALKIAQSTRVDLIISDILMPGMDGFSLCREWQKDDQLKNIPFIFYTATYTDPKDEELALSLGAERFIIKPAEPDMFIEIVSDVLKQYKTGKLDVSRKHIAEEKVFLKKYNEALIRKMEDKMLTLEQVNQALKNQTHDLGERVKELSCLNSISKLAETPEITIEEMIRGTVDLIPLAWQYPDVTSTRIKLYSDVISSSNFKEIQWKQTSDIIINGKVEGIVEVVYLEVKPESDEGPFLKEERNLINMISKQLGVIIERVQAEDSLIENENRYRSVVEDSPGVICRFTPDGTITFANQEYCRLFGKECDELIGMNIQSVIPKEGRESVMSYIDSLTEESPIKTLESKVIRHDGEIRWMRWADRALFDDKRKIFSIQSFGQDITEIVEAKQALHLEQEKAQKYLDIAEVMIVALNKEGEITLINQKGSKVLGYEESELIGRNWFETCLPEKIRKEVRQVIKKLFTGDIEPVEYNENPILTKSGEERIIAWHNTVLRDEKGNNIGVLSSGEDVTEQMQAEEEIKSLSKFPDENPNPILRFSKEGKILYASNSSAVLLNKWGRSIGESAPTDWKKQISKSLTSNEILEIEEICENRIISFILSPIKEMDYVNAYGRDITKPKRAHQLLSALNQAAVTMGVAQTHEAIFNAVAKELKRLDITCILFPVDKTQGKLIAKYLGYEPAILKAAEKLVGIKQEDFSFLIDTVVLYREVVREKKTLFTDNLGQVFQQIIPKPAKKLLPKIIQLLRIRKSILTPLIVEGQVIGVFSVQSDNLIREDIPVATAFADQLSSAWNKIRLLQNLRKTVEGTINIIAGTVDARDPYTAGHQVRVSDLAVTIAKEMGISKEQVKGIRMAGIVHDLGKIQVPAEILSKPGKISELEYELIKSHSRVGFNLLKDVDFPWPISEMVLQHHERMNGSGYPQGLKGDEIMLEARILAVADTVEAMSSHRPYRPALGIEKALKQIKQDKGILFDPDVVDACIKIFKDGYKFPKQLEFKFSD